MEKHCRFCVKSKWSYNIVDYGLETHYLLEIVGRKNKSITFCSPEEKYCKNLKKCDDEILVIFWTGVYIGKFIQNVKSIWLEKIQQYQCIGYSVYI